MPQVHKSTIKRARQSEKRRLRNKSVMSSVKSAMKRVATALDKKDAKDAAQALRDASSVLHKAVTKGALKRNTASRRISRLAHRLNALAAPSA